MVTAARRRRGDGRLNLAALSGRPQPAPWAWCARRPPPCSLRASRIRYPHRRECCRARHRQVGRFPACCPLARHGGKRSVWRRASRAASRSSRGRAAAVEDTKGRGEGLTGGGVGRRGRGDAVADHPARAARARVAARVPPRGDTRGAPPASSPGPAARATAARAAEAGKAAPGRAEREHAQSAAARSRESREGGRWMDDP